MVERIQNSRRIRIAVIGPESSGKSALSVELAQHFSWHLTPEFARAYLLDIRHPYTLQDLEFIAEKQEEWNRESVYSCICDTEMTSIRIWALEKFNEVPPIVNHFEANQDFDLYLLCVPDLPWEADPLRENQFDRDRLFELFLSRLKTLGRAFFIVKGLGENRTDSAIEAIESIIEK